MKIVNGPRGETIARIGARDYRFAVTMGALAQLETAFNSKSFDELNARLGSPSVNDLCTIVEVLTAAAGDPVSREELYALGKDDIFTLVSAVLRAFEPTQSEKKVEAPAKNRSRGKSGSV